VRVGPALAVPDVLRQLGADPAEVLKEAGVDPAVFESAENWISHEARGRLVARCVARTGCRHFGLLLGQRAGLRSFGLLGLLVKYSPDVGTALRSLVRYFHLHNRSGAVELSVEGDRATFSYGADRPPVQAGEQIGDGAVAVMLNILRELCGADWLPLEACFAHRRPDDVAPFYRFFRAPLRFDAERYALVFSAAWIDRAVPHDDAELRRLLQRQIDALEARHASDFPARVRSVLRTALLTDDAGAARVAALLSMHSRTLRRRLVAGGTTFRALVDEVRFEIARQLLEDSSLHVGGIADTLGYSDASAFTRAFRRWSGTTPARWRTARTGSASRR
jgi:AraC-like DNA-binding protein